MNIRRFLHCTRNNVAPQPSDQRRTQSAASMAGVTLPRPVELRCRVFRVDRLPVRVARPGAPLRRARLQRHIQRRARLGRATEIRQGHPLVIALVDAPMEQISTFTAVVIPVAVTTTTCGVGIRYRKRGHNSPTCPLPSRIFKAPIGMARYTFPAASMARIEVCGMHVYGLCPMLLQ